ncbi:MAG TPA: CarD family transcriptional regulator [Methylomirabilota bacterium]|jgi:RNA polymerase-interacting CarD/CdnL/TRCF family regulator|nr:CarD family transcriptional regulator [Methylomirabilota bacterium]
MTLSIGEKIIYPSHGPCLIGAVVNKLIGGTSTSFYRLAPLDDSGGELFIPVDKIRGLGIRQLVRRSEIPKLLGRLSQEAETPVLPTTARNWKQRSMDNSKLLASGSAFDLAEVVESLTGMNERRALAAHDRQTLDRAKKLLVCEIAEVLGKSKSAAAEQVDKALQVRKAG